MARKKPVKRCIGLCKQTSAEALLKKGVSYVPLKHSGQAIKEGISAILEQYKDKLPAEVVSKLHVLRKSEADILCENCVAVLFELFQQKRRQQQKLFELSRQRVGNEDEGLNLHPGEVKEIRDIINPMLESLNLKRDLGLDDDEIGDGVK